MTRGVSPPIAEAGFGVFALFASGYVLSYALRTVNAVIAPELVDQFGFSNAQLGALSSAGHPGRQAQPMLNNGYGRYLMQLLRERVY